MGLAAAAAIVGVVLAAAGAAVGTASALQQADAAEEAAKYNERVANNNALQAQFQAQAQASRIRQRNLRLMGAQIAAGSNAGIDTSSGSFQDVLYDSSLQGELDAQTALYTGKVQSDSETSRAKLFNAQGSWAQQAGAYQASGSILGGASGALGAYNTYYRNVNNPRSQQN